MAIPPAGTFEYMAIVPERSSGGEFECRAGSRERSVGTSDDVHGAWLVGLTPLLRVADAGLTPDAGPQRPWVLRSRITLTASGRPQATVAEAAFHVDKALTSRVRPGDELHLARTAAGGVGFSVIRGGELVMAVGALTAVPLGRRVVARIPMDLVASAEAVFRTRDPKFEFRGGPVEVSVSGSAAILYGGRRTVADYELFVLHGFLRGMPGVDECGALWQDGQCPEVAAQASAMLMDGPDALAISRW
jgi:hypothetical protein